MYFVIPAEAGIQARGRCMDARFRGHYDETCTRSKARSVASAAAQMMRWTDRDNVGLGFIPSHTPRCPAGRRGTSPRPTARTRWVEY